MKNLHTLLAPLQQRYDTLQKREQKIVIAGIIATGFCLFYLLLWDPVFSHLEQQQLQQQSQTQLLNWMQDTTQQIKAIRASGAGTSAQYANQSISSLADRSAISMGVKPFIQKMDTDKNGVKVQLEQASFDRIVYWLQDMAEKYGIQASDIHIEKQPAAGAVNARITLERNL
ncbi:MAG: type II secretion system protein M [Gammaproteobacteria bacterium]|nr:type II secretion system protein M [Gammaproteobacteria bacterium]